MDNLNAVVEEYIKLRDMLERMNAAHKARTEKVRKTLSEFEAYLLKKFNEMGVDRVGSPAGTAYRTTVSSATVKDWPAFLDYVVERKAWDMLEKRCSKTAVLAHLEDEGALPPGIDLYRQHTINIRRGKASA